MTGVVDEYPVPVRIETEIDQEGQAEVGAVSAVLR